MMKIAYVVGNAHRTRASKNRESRAAAGYFQAAATKIAYVVGNAHRTPRI
jgi:hypothetical protein